MNNRNLKLLAAGLLLIGVTAFGMGFLRTHQKLGAPGIITSPIANSLRLDIYLPERVLDYGSVFVPTDTNVLNGLPQDTSFAQRVYLHGDQMGVLHVTDGMFDLLRQHSSPLWLNVVLMGTDRTSIHKPQFCLRGSGWDIDTGKSVFDTIHVDGPHPYDLPVMKMVDSRDITESSGKAVSVRGIYVYWFVADHELTADHWTRMRKMATHLLATGELQRWAYVSCLGVCQPGDEDALYEKMKKFIAGAVPKFQITDDVKLASATASDPASH